MRTMLLASGLSTLFFILAIGGAASAQEQGDAGEVVKLRAELAKAKEEIAALRERVAQVVMERDKLRVLLTVREKELTHALKQFEKLNRDLAYANDILATFKEQFGEEVDRLLPNRRWPPKLLRGRVTGVDKQLGLVIINVGQRHDVAKGDQFIVSRGDGHIGRIVIDEVFPDMSAGHYLRPTMKGDVEVGDQVTTEPPPPKKIIRGKVKSVDKEQGRVVLNVGRRHGVEEGTAFIVFRGDHYVGRLMVTKVRDEESVARYDRKAMKGHVEVGDDVTTKLTDEL